MRPKGERLLEPQLRVLGKLLGDPLDMEKRSVDVLLGSIGINTLNVADNLSACAGDLLHDFGPWECQKSFFAEFRDLPGRFADLELALSANLRLAQVHLLGYPSRIMTDASDKYPLKLTSIACQLSLTCRTRARRCDVFANTRVSDKQWMTKSVETLNGLLRGASKRHGWTLSPTIDLFRRHGYCAPTGVSWFRSFPGSIKQQNNVDGTAHPIKRGHLAAFEAVQPKVRLDRTAPEPVMLVVDIKRLRFIRPDPPKPRQGLPPLLLPQKIGPLKTEVLGGARTRCLDVSAKPCRRFVVSTAGNTIAVGASVKIRQCVLNDPRAKRETGECKDSNLAAERFHVRADDWNAVAAVSPRGGEPPRQRLVRTTGPPGASGAFSRLEVEYTITKTAPSPTRTPSTVGGAAR